MDRIPDHRFPPLPVRSDLEFPIEPPYDVEIASLSGFWIIAECGCRTGRHIPCRLLAAQIGWKVPLRGVLGRLRCQQCNERPKALTLVDNPAYDTLQYGKCMRSLVLQSRLPQSA